MNISRTELEILRATYPKGSKIVLLEDIDDPWNKALKKGMKGTVNFIDDAGTIHPTWENGSTLGVVFGVDKVKLVKEH